METVREVHGEIISRIPEDATEEQYEQFFAMLQIKLAAVDIILEHASQEAWKIFQVMGTGAQVWRKCD